jgi:gamma-glutamyl phosphate reductase
VQAHRQQHQFQQQLQQQLQQQQQQVAAKDVAAALDQEMQMMSMQRLLALQERIKDQEDSIRHLQVSEISV